MKIIIRSLSLLLSFFVFIPFTALADSGKGSDNIRVNLPRVGGELIVESSASLNGAEVLVDYVDKKLKNNETYAVTVTLSGPCTFDDSTTVKTDSQAAAFSKLYNVNVASGATTACNFNVKVTGQANYNQSYTYKIQQHLHWKDPVPASKIANDPSFNMRAEGRNLNGNPSNRPVTYSSENNAICTIDAAGKVSNIGAGICKISAAAPGDTNWTATTIASELIAGSWRINKDKQEIIVTTPLPESVEVGTSYTAVAMSKSENLGSNTGLPLSFNASGCIVQSSNATSATLNFDRVGTCSLALTQMGDNKYEAATAKLISTVVTPINPQSFAYVKPQATGNANCTSWANACANIQTAINMADAVYIAKGRYIINTPLQMKANTRLFGGYLGTEANMSQAKPNGAVNLTILTADKDNNDTLVDGYTASAAGIKGSNTANIIIATSLGMGVADAFYLSDLILTGAANGAIAISGSNVYIDNTLFVGNKAADGGAISSANSLVNLRATSFIANHATAKGGAIANIGSNSDIRIEASLFANNIAANEGGAISSPEGKLVITNATFSSNSLSSTTGAGGALHIASNNGTTIQYATLINNSAGTQAAANGNGGAIYAASTAANIVLSSSLILNNKADKGGNIFGIDKINSDNRNIVGFNGASGMTTTANAAYNFAGNGSSQSFTTLDETIAAIIEPTLKNNGGFIASHELALNSVAKNYIPATSASCGRRGGAEDVVIDGRLLNRPAIEGTNCDVGAYEASEGFCDIKKPSNILGKSLFPSAVNDCDNMLFAELGMIENPLLLVLALLFLYRSRKLKVA